jgi:energy-coupling factor transporter ATP-binding protein EcfA2
MSVQNTNWVFRLSNPTDDEKIYFSEKLKEEENVRYYIFQSEVGKKGGTFHFQGYLVLHKKKTLKWLKKNINDRTHFKVRRGTHDQARDYCRKEDTRVPGPAIEWGDPPTKGGTRTDLAVVQAALDDGASEVQVAMDHFGVFCRYFRAISRYRTLRGFNQRTEPTKTFVIYGPTGVGKSRLVFELTGRTAYWLLKPNGNSIFFDGYDGQEDVVIDEFNGWLPFRLVLSMCDRYPLQVNTKGGSISFNPKRIWFTSNSSPEEWWKSVYRDGHYDPFRRRISGDLGVSVEAKAGTLWESIIKAKMEQWFPAPVTGDKRKRSDSQEKVEVEENLVSNSDSDVEIVEAVGSADDCGSDICVPATPAERAKHPDTIDLSSDSDSDDDFWREFQTVDDLRSEFADRGDTNPRNVSRRRVEAPRGRTELDFMRDSPVSWPSHFGRAASPPDHHMFRCPSCRQYSLCQEPSPSPYELVCRRCHYSVPWDK